MRSRVFVDATLWLVTLCVAGRSLGAEPDVGKPTAQPTLYGAFELYDRDDLQGAYTMYLQISSNAATKTNWREGYQAEWWMGVIEERLGRLEAAHEHYEKSLFILRDARPADSLLVQKAELGLLPVLTSVCTQEGKVGCAFATHTEGDRLLDLFWTSMQAAKAKAGTNYHRFALDHDTFVTSRFLTWATVGRARWLQRTGQLDEAEQSLRALLAEIETQWQERLAEYHGYPPAGGRRSSWVWQDQDLADLWRELGKQAAFLERFDEAVTFGAKMEAVPPEHRKIEDGWTQMVEYAAWLAQRDGVSQRVWDLLDQSLKHCEGLLPYYTAWMRAWITEADLLAQDGQIEAALPLLDKVIESVRAKEHAELLARALKSRARHKLTAGYSGSVADDLEESLALYRTLGNKVEEVELYELYARWLGAEGRHAEALQTWEDAYQLCETLRLHYRSLHMLLGMAELQLCLGNRAEAARIWERINKFVVAHKGLPEPTQLRLHLAQMDYLKFQGDQRALQAAYSDTLAFVKVSVLTPYQTRSFSSYDVGKPLVATTTGAQTKSTVDLQPVMMITHVSTGEFAHARFGIFNPSIRAARGRVRLVSDNTQFEWTPTDRGWNVGLSPGTRAVAGAAKEITIPPGSASGLYFEVLPSTSGTTNHVSITWQGESTAEAVWEFSGSPDSRTVAIINASLAGENPFYAVPFYHEIYFRGAAPGVRNFRVKTSEPCRVEILDATADKLLAIDATGDGDFDGPGDVLYVDQDGDGFPEFVLSKERDTASFELLVYPATRTDRGQGEIEIRLLLEENHVWVEQAIDRLVVK